MNLSINSILTGIANWLLAMLAICLTFEVCHLFRWGLGSSVVIIPVFTLILYNTRQLATAIGKLVTTHLAQQFLSGDILCPCDAPADDTPKLPTNNDIAMKRLDLFHTQFEKSQEEIAKEVAKQQEVKLQKILQYTTDTFCRIGLTEHEIFQIRECVEYLVKNEKVLSLPDLKIERRPDITQISLKNFAWNIAYQYKLPGHLAAQFVMITFHEWFADSTLYTVVKNLKTTSGNHAIPIDTHILKKY